MAVSIFLRTFVSVKMTKDEIISNLLEQLKASNEQITALTKRVTDLTAQIIELTARLEYSDHSIKQKDDVIQKEKNRNKGLTTLLGKSNEQ